jgi:hypothetical protein
VVAIDALDKFVEDTVVDEGGTCVVAGTMRGMVRGVEGTMKRAGESEWHGRDHVGVHAGCRQHVEGAEDVGASRGGEADGIG